MNQGAGARHEAHVRHMAMLEQLLLVQNGLRAKRLGDRLVALPTSDVDFLCYGNAAAGEVCAFDAKSFEGPRFGRSQLTAHQIDTLQQYAKHGLHAGYVILLRQLDQVFFFPIDTICQKKKRAGFGPDDGVLLGHRPRFSLRRIFQLERPCSSTSPLSASPSHCP